MIDLGKTEHEERLVVVTLRELDGLYEELIASERAAAAAQTDLLLLPQAPQDH